MSMLLGGAAPAILVAAAIAAHDSRTNAATWVLAIGASVLLWGYALVKAAATLHTTRRIRARIIYAETAGQAAMPTA